MTRGDFRRKLRPMAGGGMESEWKTGKQRIDTKLRAGHPIWQIIPWTAGLETSRLTCHAVEEYPTANGPADYALFVLGVLLAIVEAKKVTVNTVRFFEASPMGRR